MALHPESASGPVIWMRVSFASSAGARRHDSVGAGVPDWVAGVCAEPERSQLAWRLPSPTLPDQKADLMTVNCAALPHIGPERTPAIGWGESSGAERAERGGRNLSMTVAMLTQMRVQCLTAIAIAAVAMTACGVSAGNTPNAPPTTPPNSAPPSTTVPTLPSPGPPPPSLPRQRGNDIDSIPALWTIYDCAFAVDMLTEDSQLDARAFLGGPWAGLRSLFLRADRGSWKSTPAMPLSSAEASGSITARN